MRTWLPLLLAVPLWAGFDLVTRSHVARLFVPAAEPGCVRLAAGDLARDVYKITGRTPEFATSVEACGQHCIVVASGDSLRQLDPAMHKAVEGKWEAYHVKETRSGLLIAGSDERGAMFGVYAFAAQYLKVDPLYFWSGREPVRRNTLTWDHVTINSPEPTFRYRGWFINDEDLLAEWKAGGGKRDINYPFYAQVTHPEVLAHVYEAALRLGFNLIIPASFTDIDNPAEERMISDATQRGLMVSMHHVEPMGVSAFAFDRYWKSRGRTVPYSFHSHRAEFEEVWRHYARKWSRYPGVVWQLGLRGVADRPAWYHDPTAPNTDAARGAMITDAMQLQWQIVRSIDKRSNPPATTTLWMEGASLHRDGHLAIPPEVTVVFADNTPGWKMQADFYDTPRVPGPTYGIYYHHAVWGWGPHFVQAVPPWKTHEILSAAIARRTNHYAILNVSNVREFVLGLAATSHMLRDFGSFDPRAFLRQWCAERFGAAGDQAASAYTAFFDSFYVDPEAGTPLLLDGTTLHEGTRRYTLLLRKLKGAPDPPKPATESLRRFLPNMPSPGAYAPDRLLALVRKQQGALEIAAAKLSLDTLGSAPGRELLESNLIAQRQILGGLLAWLESAILASRAEPVEVERHARAGLRALASVREAQATASRGKWRDWYRGDRKMNLAAAERLTNQVLEQARAQTGHRQ